MTGKRIILLMIMTLAAETALAQDRVRKIEVQGNKYTDSAKIMKAIKTKVGDTYTGEGASADIQSIYELNCFDNIEVDVSDYEDGVKLTFLLTEKPIISRIDFKGNKKFSDTALKKKVESEPKKVFDKKAMLEDVTKIEEAYKEKGYSDVRVEPFTTLEDNGEKTVITFFITEGNEIKIEEVNLIGVKSFDRKEILKGLKVKKNKYYRPEQLEESKEKIETFYRDSGFLNFTSGETLVTYNKERTKVFITIFVYEGLRYRVGGISFKGNREFDAKDLYPCIELKKQSFFSEQKLNMSMANVQEKYAEKGYIKLSIVPQYEFDDENKTAGIIFILNEGEVVYIGDVFVEGNSYTKDYVIKRESLVKSGDVFNIKRIRRSQEKIYNLGLFSDVRLNISDTGLPNKTDLVFSVEEQMAGMLSMGVGYNQVNGLVGTLQLSENNLFGKGKRVNLMLDFGAITQNYQLSFTEPWLFKKHITCSADIYNTRRYRAAWDEIRNGTGVRVGPYLSDIMNTMFGYRLERIEVSSVETDETQNGKRTSSSISGMVIRDNRDNIFDASRGSRFSASLENAGNILGGDNNFVKSDLSYSVFFRTFWKFVLACQLRVGGVYSYRYGGRDPFVPIYEKYFVGGGETVRGYEYGYFVRVPEIGPSGGGNMMLVGNLEYKFPLVIEKGHSIIQGVVFLDVGGAWNNLNEMELTTGQRATRMKAGTGFGLRISPMPMFPIRVDFGYGLNKISPADKRGMKFYFTIGQTF